MNLLLGGFSCKVDVLKQVTEVQNELKFVSTDIIFENISETSLKAAAQLFIYLHPSFSNCPFIEFNKWFGIWSPFYIDLFKRQSPSKILLTLNRVIKTTSVSLQSKAAAKDYFTRTAASLSLKYEDIQRKLPKKSQKVIIKGESQILEKSEGNLQHLFLSF